MPTKSTNTADAPGGLTKSQLQVLKKSLEKKNIRAGGWLWKDGEISSHGALVLRGEIKMIMSSEFPDPQISLGVYGADAFLLDRSYLCDKVKNTSAMALNDAEVLLINPHDLHIIIQKDHNIAQNLYEMMLKTLFNQIDITYDTYLFKNALLKTKQTLS